MPKIRIHELSKQTGISSKIIIEKLNSYGMSVNNHMSSIEDAEVKRLTEDLQFKNKSGAKASEADDRAKPEPAPEIPVQTEKPSAHNISAGHKSEPPSPMQPIEKNEKTETRISSEVAADSEGRPLRPRPEGTVDAESRPLRPRPRPEGAVGPDGRPLHPRPRPEGTVDAEGRPLRPRPRPEGAVDSEGRPLRPRPRPEGAVGPDGRPLRPRPRPEGAVDSEGRPLRPRPRPEGAVGPDGRPLRPRPRPEGMVDDEGRPIRPRPRPEGMVDADGRPLRPRPRPEGMVDAEGRPLRPRPRPEGSIGPDGRPLRPRPRPEGAVDSEGRPLRPRPRPEGAVDSEGRPLRPRPRPEGAVDAEGRPLRPRPRHDDITAGDAAIANKKIEHENEKETINEVFANADASAQSTVISEAAGITQAEKPEAKPDTGNTQSPEQQPRSAETGAQAQAPQTQTLQTKTPQYQAPQNQGGERPSYANRTSQTGAPQRTDGRGRSEYPQRTDRQGQNQPRPFQERTDRPRTPGQSGPDRFGQRPPSTGQRPFQSGPRPGQSGPRPGGFQPRGDGPPRFAGPRPGFAPKDGGGINRTASRPALGVKKDDKKPAEPTKDDRKQGWQKNEQMRTVKSKDTKEADKKDIKKTFDRKDGHRRKGSGKPKEARAAAKRIIPVKIEPVISVITVPNEITIRDLAEKLRKSNADIIKALMKKGIMATANQTVDFETATLIAETFDVLVEEYVEVDAFEQAFAAIKDEAGELTERPPVVVVMGHVDHGKTSLLDAIRDTSVTKTEAGGITQHIGAYTVDINGRPITFLDTPGHEAFTAMRMRGAQVTDIAILVVAANDGVMPQTVEAINHAKAAGVDIIVAINKVDLPSANPDRVKQELTEHGLLVEDWGGETIAVPVSALQKTGIEQLLEMIIIVSEIKELRANPNKAAKGSIIEAKLDKGRGPVATVLVQDGTLRIGDPVVAGACFGKIRAMTDDKGRSIKEAGPSIPAEIIGLSEVPSAGDTFYVAGHEKQARQLSETVVAKGRESLIKSTPTKVSLDDLFNQIQAGSVKELNIVIKADVQGSVEALKASLDKLSNEKVRVKVIHGGVGAINESDVMLASASNAIVIGFNIRPEPMAKTVADAEKIDMRLYRVIYSAIDDIEAAMKGMLDPEYQEKVLGHAEIRQLFKASGVGTIAGCHVSDGRITRNAKVRIVRDGRVVYDGTLETLRRFKDDAREVAAGYECGMLFNKFNDIHENDKVEAYVMEEIPR